MFTIIAERPAVAGLPEFADYLEPEQTELYSPVVRTPNPTDGLQDTYDHANARFFQGSLRCVATIGGRSNGPWELNGQSFYDIKVDPKARRDSQLVVGEILHGAVHAWYLQQHFIKDQSKHKDDYHDKYFQAKLTGQLEVEEIRLPKSYLDTAEPGITLEDWAEIVPNAYQDWKNGKTRSVRMYRPILGGKSYQFANEMKQRGILEEWNPSFHTRNRRRGVRMVCPSCNTLDSLLPSLNPSVQRVSRCRRCQVDMIREALLSETLD